MTITRVLDAPPGRVVEVACDFRTLHLWHPAFASVIIEETEGEEPVRLLELGGSTVRERLTETSEDGRGYAYDIDAHPMPIRDGRGLMRVDPGERPFESRLRWSVTFASASPNAPEAMLGKMLEALMRTGVEALAAQFDGEAETDAQSLWGQSGEVTLPEGPPPMED